MYTNEDSMYQVFYINKKGHNITLKNNDHNEIINVLKNLLKRRIEATVKLNNRLVGRVWEMSVRDGWNYYIEEPTTKQ